MANYNYIKPERVYLYESSEFNESWVQEKISEDPSILNLGELELKDKERRQPSSGRLDLLLVDPEDDYRRYEVEIQLGITDESHIIRTIEYWDIERKRYPQYEHCAVIVAEEITGRFLNVISLFNGFIPLIAIQMSMYRIGDNISLVFTKVLDETTLGVEEEDEYVEPANREYWEKTRGTKETVEIADNFLKVINSFAPGFTLKYNRNYIGLAKDGQPKNFVLFKAKRGFLRVEIKIRPTEEIQRLVEESSLDVLGYDKRSGRYRIRIVAHDFEKNEEKLLALLKAAFMEFGNL